MKYSEVRKLMRKFNEKHGIERKVDTKKNEKGELIKMVADIIIKQELFKKEYTKEQRTYRFDNYNKALTAKDLGYSIFAFCPLDDDMWRIENMEDKNIENAEIVEIVE